MTDRLKRQTQELFVGYIALYIRVSTDDQANEGVSLEEQEERLKAYCKAHAWTSEVKVYNDDGYSAKDLNRPELRNLIQDVKDGLVSKIIITKLDRMSRKLLDLLNLIELYQDHDVAFISVGETFDTSTPAGRLVVQVLGAVAEFERERNSERVFDTMIHSAKSGKWLTQSPYGYNLIEKELEINETEAEIVGRVFHEYLNRGYGYYKIAKGLNDDEVPSKSEVGWSHRTIKLMLTNPAYKGTLVWNRKGTKKRKKIVKNEDEWITVEDCLPAIVDKKTWERVQQKIERNPRIGSRAHSSPHLLGGILRCGNCGYSMSASYSGSTNNRYRIYRCSANKNKGVCTSKQYKADELESWFKIGLLKLFESGAATISLRIRNKYIENQKSDIEKKIQSAKTRYKRKTEAFAAQLIEIDDLKEEKQKLDELITQLNNQKINNDDFDVNEIEKMVQHKITNIVNAIDILPVEEAKPLLHTLVETITVKNEKELEIALTNFQ
jgi:site-specific DNA recombinase